jgi:hypothetical protein
MMEQATAKWLPLAHTASTRSIACFFFFLLMMLWGLFPCLDYWAKPNQDGGSVLIKLHFVVVLRLPFLSLAGTASLPFVRNGSLMVLFALGGRIR